MPNRTGIELAKQSWALLKKRKSLYIFPTLSTVLTLGALIAVLIPLSEIETNAWARGGHVDTKTFGIFFGILLLFFMFVNVVSLIFSAALIVCATKQIKNEPYSLMLGVKAMFQYLPRLYRWQSLGNLFGGVIRFRAYWMDSWLQSKIAIEFLKSLPWAIATTLVVPVLVNEKIKPKEAIKRSAELMRKTWGTDNQSLVSCVNIGLKVFFLRILAFIPVAIGLLSGIPIALYIGGAISASIFITTTVINSAAQITLLSALYLFATGQDTSTYYDQKLLKKAFQPVKHTLQVS